MAAASVVKKEPLKDVIQEGLLMRHKNGKTVAVVKKDIKAAADGQRMHLVIESRTGRRFKALESNLKLEIS